MPDWMEKNKMMPLTTDSDSCDQKLMTARFFTLPAVRGSMVDSPASARLATAGGEVSCDARMRGLGRVGRRDIPSVRARSNASLLCTFRQLHRCYDRSDGTRCNTAYLLPHLASGQGRAEDVNCLHIGQLRAAACIRACVNGSDEPQSWLLCDPATWSAFSRQLGWLRPPGRVGGSSPPLEP